jgi:hypothetical protein
VNAGNSVARRMRRLTQLVFKLWLAAHRLAQTRVTLPMRYNHYCCHVLGTTELLRFDVWMRYSLSAGSLRALEFLYAVSSGDPMRYTCRLQRALRSPGPLIASLHRFGKVIPPSRLPNHTTTNTSPRAPNKQSFAPRNSRCVVPGFELVDVADDNVGASACRMRTGRQEASAAVMPVPDVVRR